VDIYPEAVEHVADYGWLPLHCACLNKDCPNEVVQYVVCKYTESLRIPWHYRGLPLYCLLGRLGCQYSDDHICIVKEGIRLDLTLVRVLVEA